MDRFERETELINSLQEELHKLFDFFFNGTGITFINKLFYPNIFFFSPKINLIIQKIDSILKNMESSDEFSTPAFFNLRGYVELIASRKRFTSKNIAKLISCYYLFWGDILQKLKTKLVCQEVTISRFLKKDIHMKKDFCYRKPILDLQRYISQRVQNYLLAYILHGSLSTLDYIKGHSDVDTLAILKKEVMENPCRLMHIRKVLCRATKYFYFIDPMQHHGHYIIAEQDMQYYPTHFFPLVLFNYSTSLLPQPIKLYFQERVSEKENKQLLMEYAKTFRKFSEPSNYPGNIYALKYLLQAVLLFPSIYFQYKGKPLHKGKAIHKIKNTISKNSYLLIKNIEKIRKNNLFNISKETPLLIQNLFSYIPNPLVWPFLYRAFCNKIPKSVNALIKNDLTAQLSELAEFLEMELKK